MIEAPRAQDLVPIDTLLPVAIQYLRLRLDGDEMGAQAVLTSKGFNEKELQAFADLVDITKDPMEVIDGIYSQLTKYQGPEAALRFLQELNLTEEQLHQLKTLQESLANEIPVSDDEGTSTLTVEELVEEIVVFAEKNREAGSATDPTKKESSLPANEVDELVTICTDVIHSVTDSFDDSTPEFTISDRDLERVEAALQGIITAESNYAVAQKFLTAIRRNWKLIALMLKDGFGNPFLAQYDYSDQRNQAEFSALDAVSFADTLQMPLALYCAGGIHWVLLLEPPQKIGPKWQAKVYNPFYAKEQSVEIPFSGEVMTSGDFESAQIHVNSVALDQFATGTYNYSLLTDAVLAKFSRMKNIQMQEDSFSCGFLCVFNMMLRAALLPGNEAFKATGVDQIKNFTTTDELETGITIATDRDLLGEQRHLLKPRTSTVIPRQQTYDVSIDLDEL